MPRAPPPPAATDPMPLTRDVRPGETIRIGDDIVINVERASGQRARLSINTTLPIRHDKAGAKPAASTEPTAPRPTLIRPAQAG